MAKTRKAPRRSLAMPASRPIAMPRTGPYPVMPLTYEATLDDGMNNYNPGHPLFTKTGKPRPQGMLDWVGGAAEDTGNWIAGAAEDTADWVSTAAEDVWSFFKGLFGGGDEPAKKKGKKKSIALPPGAGISPARRVPGQIPAAPYAGFATPDESAPATPPNYDVRMAPPSGEPYIAPALRPQARVTPKLRRPGSRSIGPTPSRYKR